MKKVLAILLAVTMLLGAVAAFSSCKKKTDENNDTTEEKTFTVGICQLTPHPALDAATNGFIKALEDELGKRVETINKNANGDVAVCSTIINDFTSREVDLIMANATDALRAAASGTSTIPVLGTSITDYATALGITFEGTVGTNVSGTSDLAPLDEQAAMITELFPEAKTVSIIYCASEVNSIFQVNKVKATLEAAGITVKLCAFAEANELTAVVPVAAEADVIYIPTDNTAADNATFINSLIGTTPVVAGEEAICKACGVATLTISYYDLGYTTGKMAAKILRGEAKVSEMPIEFAPSVEKKFNAQKCADLGINTAALIEKGFTAID